MEVLQTDTRWVMFTESSLEEHKSGNRALASLLVPTALPIRALSV